MFTKSVLEQCIRLYSSNIKSKENLTRQRRYFIGPYRCGSSNCEVEDRINNAIQNAEAGLIDPVENVQDMPVYVFAGGNDASAQRNGPVIEEFFETLGGVVDTNFTNPCGHGVVSAS